MKGDFYRKTDGKFPLIYVPWLDEWIHSHWLSRRLSRINKTPQDWYDTFILNISSKEDRPKCSNPNCKNFGKELPFISALFGYASHCDHKCNGSSPEFIEMESKIAKSIWKRDGYRDSMIRIHKNPSDKVREVFSKAGTKTWEDKDYYYLQSAKIAYGSARKQPYELSYFYILKGVDCFKIGVTVDPDSRVKFLGSNKFDYLFRGFTEVAARLEYDTKLKYKQYWVESSKDFFRSTETFSLNILDNLLSDISQLNLIRII